MKKLLLFVLLTMGNNILYAHVWEMGLKVIDVYDFPIAKSVTLYKDNGFYYE